MFTGEHWGINIQLLWLREILIQNIYCYYFSFILIKIEAWLNLCD